MLQSTQHLTEVDWRPPAMRKQEYPAQLPGSVISSRVTGSPEFRRSARTSAGPTLAAGRIRSHGILRRPKPGVRRALGHSPSCPLTDHHLLTLSALLGRAELGKEASLVMCDSPRWWFPQRRTRTRTTTSSSSSSRQHPADCWRHRAPGPARPSASGARVGETQSLHVGSHPGRS